MKFLFFFPYPFTILRCRALHRGCCTSGERGVCSKRDVKPGDLVKKRV